MKERYFQISAYIDNNHHELVNNYSSMVLCIHKSGIYLDAYCIDKKDWHRVWNIEADAIYSDKET